MKTLKYQNIKSGKLYTVLSFDIINATNKDDGERMVLYEGERKNSTDIAQFVRNYDEFMIKFIKYE